MADTETLTALWRTSEQARPDTVALVAAGRRLTYRETGAAIRSLAAALASRWGVARGDVVALLAPNGPEFVVGYFGIVFAGATVQPIDERLTGEEIEGVLTHSGARHLIVHAALWPRFEKLHGRLPALERVLGWGVTAAGVDSLDALPPTADVAPAIAVAPGDVAELMYTSGTVGEPKGVMRSHANVRAASRNSIRGFGYRADDVILIVMPMSHSSALVSQMMPLLELGGTLVMLERFAVPAVLAAIRREGVTCMRAVPAMMRALLTAAGFRAEELPSLRLLINSSAAIDPQTYLAIKHRFGAIQVMNSYGLTEASTCTVLPDAQALVRPDSVGAPIEGVEMAVLDDGGRAVADGGEGELCVRGPHVFLGYRGRPDASRAAQREGWLRTGDLGHRDASGYFFLHGRRDDLISCGGLKFAPLEVENCLLELAEVGEVAVVGVPHPALGQVAKAFVVPSAGATVHPKRLVAHAARGLASYKVPFHVEIVADLPRNSVGKVLRRALAMALPPPVPVRPAESAPGRKA